MPLHGVRMINPYLLATISVLATFLMLYLLKLLWSVLLYTSQLAKYKHPVDNNKISIESPGGQHHVFFLGGYGQSNYQEMSTTIPNTQVHAVVPNTYSNFLYPYSFRHHAETLNRLSDEALSNPNNQVTILGFSTGCIPALIHYDMNKNYSKQNLNYVLVNGYSSFYDLLTKGYPILGFIIFAIHFFVATLLFTLTQSLMLGQITLLSIVLISITALLISSGVCIIALYTLTPENIHAITKAKLIEPIESIFNQCKSRLNPFRLNTDYAKIRFIALIIPNTIICGFLMLLTIPYMLGLIAKQIVLHTGKPFIYLLLWIMNSHYNNINCLKKHSTNLLAKKVTIFQSSKDSVLSKEVRIAPAVNDLSNTVVHINREKHHIKNNLDGYLGR